MNDIWSDIPQDEAETLARILHRLQGNVSIEMIAGRLADTIRRHEHLFDGIEGALEAATGIALLDFKSSGMSDRECLLVTGILQDRIRDRLYGGTA